MAWSDKVSNLLGRCTSSAAFGEDMTHTPAGGDAQTFKGIWSDVYQTVDPNDGIPVMSDEPNVGARLSDFDVEPKKGDLITRAGTNYKVRVPEKDGEGGVTLVLEKEV